VILRGSAKSQSCRSKQRYRPHYLEKVSFHFWSLPRSLQTAAIISTHAPDSNEERTPLIYLLYIVANR